MHKTPEQQMKSTQLEQRYACLKKFFFSNA